MPLASITRLRVRSARYMPEFIWRALSSLRQARQAPGCLAADVRHHAGLVFWTRTVWADEAAMRAYLGSGAHRAALPKLQHWCDEASAAHWTQQETAMPDWPMAETRMRTDGHTSRVRHPSAAHERGETVPGI